MDPEFRMSGPGPIRVGHRRNDAAGVCPSIFRSLDLIKRPSRDHLTYTCQ